MKPQPIFPVERDTVVRHEGTLAGQWRWMRLYPDRDKHWWLQRHWWAA
jgi:hypothetical protein